MESSASVVDCVQFPNMNEKVEKVVVLEDETRNNKLNENETRQKYSVKPTYWYGYRSFVIYLTCRYIYLFLKFLGQKCRYCIDQMTSINILIINDELRARRIEECRVQLNKGVAGQI